MLRERLLDEKNGGIKNLVEGRERLRDFWNGIVQVTV
jgi:hypothetical protein